MDTLSKMRKAGLTLPSVTGVNILRDPPKSIHTRKHEPVNVGDVLEKVRENKDRLSENVRYYPTGVNPMVSVSYANRGGGSNVTSLSSLGMAHNPYKVVKDGAFRPPMFRQEDLLPLSRQKRMWTTAQTRAKPQYQSKTAQEVTIDFAPIKTAVLPKTTRDIGGQAVETYVGNAVLDPLTYSVISKLKGTSTYSNYDNLDWRNAERHTVEKPLTSYMTPGYTVQVFDKTTRSISELHLPDKKLKDIVATAAVGGHVKFDGPNGQTIKLKDYTWTVYQTAKNTNRIVLETNDPNIELDRNMPLTAVNSRIRARIAGNPEVLEPILENNRPVISAHATPVIINGVSPVNNRDINIHARKLRLEGYGPKPSIVTGDRPDLTPMLYGKLKTSSRRV